MNIPSAKPLRICVVENNADTRFMLNVLLTQHGHEVALSDCFNGARDLLQKQDFDVLISDIGLPDGNGWQLLEDVAQRQPQMFAIAISGYGTTADQARSRASGYRYHLVKPVAFASIAPLLREAAEGSGLRLPN